MIFDLTASGTCGRTLTPNIKNNNNVYITEEINNTYYNNNKGNNGKL